MAGETGRRRYDSLRRTARAQETRAEIAEAARKLFVAKGWSATTVREVAAEAGVSVPTVYAAYGDKTGLVRALADSADLAADVPREVEDLEAATTPAGQLAAMAAYDRRLFERAGDVIALVREAGRTEPELATAYLAGRAAGDRIRVEVFSAWPAGVLRAGLDVAEAVDRYAALCNLDVFTTLTEERSWPPERVERWWTELLPRELLAQPGRPA